MDIDLKMGTFLQEHRGMEGNGSLTSESLAVPEMQWDGERWPSTESWQQNRTEVGGSLSSF